MKLPALLLLCTGAVLARPDGPGGHHGAHHGEHHGEHGAKHGEHHDAKHGEHHGAGHEAVQKAAPQHPVKQHRGAPQHHATPHHAPQKAVPHHAAPHHAPVQHHAPAPHRAPQHAPRPAHHRAAPRPPRRPLAPRPVPQRSPFRGQRPVPLHQRQVPRRRPAPRPLPGRHHANPFLQPGAPRPERAPRFPPKKPARQPLGNIPQAVPLKSVKPALPASKSLAQEIKENEHFSTFYTALKAADMVTQLEKASKTYTIFAPTNAAFDKVPVDTLNQLLGDQEGLRKVLRRHIVPNRRLEGKDVPAGSTKLTSSSGEELKADRGKFVQVSSSNAKAFVVKFDFLANNGVYHAIDQVL